MKNQLSIGIILTSLFLLFVFNISAQSQEPDIRELKPNQTIEREMTGAETHRYKFDLKASEFFQVRVEQKGVDVLLKILDSEGNVLATMDSPNSKEGPETLSFIAKQDGTYKLEISGFDEKAEKAIYTIKREFPRTATAKDKRRVEVEKLFMDGMTARDTAGQDEIAVNKLEVALNGWRELDDEYLVQLTDQQVKQLKETSKSKSELENKIAFRKLVIGENIKAEIKKGEGHLYPIEINEEQTIRVEINENGGNVRVVLVRFNDRKQIAISEFGGGYDREIILSKIEQTGSYVIGVFVPNGASSGEYEILATIKKFEETNDSAEIRAIEFLKKGVKSERIRTSETYQSEVEKLESSLILWKKTNNKYWQAFTTRQIGLLHYEFGDNKKALKFYYQALNLFKESHDITGEARTLNEIGATYKLQGEYTKAMQYFNKSLPLRKSIGDKFGEAATLHNIAGVYSDLGEKEKAIQYYTQTLPLLRDVGNATNEAHALELIGRIYDESNNKSNAILYFQKALNIQKSLRNKNKEALLNFVIGFIYEQTGKKRLALIYLKRSLLIFNDIEEKDKNILVLLNRIAHIYLDLEEFQKSLTYFNKLIVFRKENNDKKGEAQTLNAIASIYSNLGENNKALSYYKKALSILIAIKNKDGMASAHNNIGMVYLEIGDYEKAIDYLNQALILHQELNKNGQSETLNNLGVLFSSLGEKNKALNYYKQALSLDKSSGNKKGEARLLNHIGSIYHAMGEFVKAANYYGQALLVLKPGDNKSLEAMTFQQMASVLADVGEKYEALKNYKTSLNLYKSLEDKNGQSTVLSNIGTVYYELGEMQKAFENFQESLTLSKAVGDKSGQALVHDWMMIYWTHSKNLRFATFYGKRSINLRQELRQNIVEFDKELQKSYLNSVESVYRRITDILIKQNRLEEAHQVLNSFKDQQFFDFDQSQIKEPSPLSLTPSEKEFSSLYEKASQRVGEVGRRLEELKLSIGTRQPTAEENAELQKLEREVKTASDEFLAVLKKAEVEFSKKPDEKDKVGEVPDLLEMRAALRKLNEQTGQKAVAVYQVVGEENFSTLVITPDSIDKIEVPVKGEELNEKALQLWALLKSDKYDTTKLSKEIYDVVFKPLEAKLPKDTTTIMWATDGNLRYLPMAALFDGKQFLVERYTHSVFTRADSNRMLAKVSNNWTGTGFGSSERATVKVLGTPISFSPLPGVTKELSEIFKTDKKGILNGETYSDKQFSKPNFIKALKKQRPLVHIASHFSFRPGDEARSFLLMGDNTAFTLEEMKREKDLFKGVELLTLSACNTAAQQPGANGREIDGFAELAQRLGAGAVMATLWQVSDDSTPWLMRDFYTTRETKKGMTKAESLQQSQLGLLNGTAKIKSTPTTRQDTTTKIKIEIVPNGTDTKRSSNRGVETFRIEKNDAPLYKSEGKAKYAHPYYWSPFVLYGNWK